MIPPKKLKTILKKSDSSYSLKESRVYLLLFSFSLLTSFIFVPISETSKVEIFKRIVASIGIIFFGISLLYYFSNEYKRLFAINSIRTAIIGLMGHGWDWKNSPMFLGVEYFHPSIMKHPITLYLYGSFLLNEGHVDEGKYLIKEAISRDNKLNKIKIFPKLNKIDAEYLMSVVENNKVLSESIGKLNLLKCLWSKKKIRYLMISFIAFIIFLHFLSNIFRVIK